MNRKSETLIDKIENQPTRVLQTRATDAAGFGSKADRENKSISRLAKSFNEYLFRIHAATLP